MRGLKMNIDDDFEEKASDLKNNIVSKEQSDSKFNKVALGIKISSWAALIVGIIGFCMSIAKGETIVGFIFLELCIGVVLSFLILFGFAETIQILHDIRRN